MQNAAVGGIAIEPKDRNWDRNWDRNDAYRSVVSDLVSLIDHVHQPDADRSAIAREMAVGSQEISANVIVLDDVTPPLCEGNGGVESLRCQSCHRPPFAARFQGFNTRHQRLFRALTGACCRRHITVPLRRAAAAMRPEANWEICVI